MALRNMTENVSLMDAHYDYDYPREMDLSPDSDLHRELIAQLAGLIQNSQSFISNRYENWNKLDTMLTGYVDLTESEKENRTLDPKRPVSMVIPASYAILESLLSQLSKRIFRNPVFNYEAIDPDDYVSVLLLEQVIQMQIERFSGKLKLHTWLRDSLVYSFGAIVPIWNTKLNQNQEVIYEGNRFKVIDPYMILPDPSVPLEEMHEGEYFGWLEKANRLQILKMEVETENVFNARYVKHVSPLPANYYGESRRGAFTGTSYPYRSIDSNEYEIAYLYVNLIPQEYGLGSGEYPELWLFAVVNQQLIIQASPVDLEHNSIPVAVAAPTGDGHSPVCASILEIIRPMQDTMDWLYSTRMANVRKSLNDMFLVDPTRVNMKDILNPQPGKLIRTRGIRWGKESLKDVVMQFPVSDVTQSHLGDASFLQNEMGRISGSTESMQGQVQQSSERISATATRNSEVGGLLRAAKLGSIIHAQGLTRLGMLLASQTSQLTEIDQFVKIQGANAQRLQEIYEGRQDAIAVSPGQLEINSDVMVSNPTIDGSSDPQVWLQLLQLTSNSQELAAVISPEKIFYHLAEQLGVNEVWKFKREIGSTSVMTDELVEEQVQSGNLIPMEETVNG